MSFLRTAVLAVLAVLLSAPSALADAKSEDAAIAAARRHHLNQRGMETEALKAAAGKAARQGERLILTLAGAGKPQIFADNRKACSDDNAADCARYRLVAALPSRHAFLVSKSVYEGCADLILVDDRSGRRTTLSEVPVFSPDGERLLVQNDCEMGGGADEHHLEIWKRAGDGWKLEWSYTDDQAMAAEPKLMNLFHSQVASWDGDRITLRFTATIDGFASDQHWTGTLTRTPKGWRLEAGRFHTP